MALHKCLSVVLLLTLYIGTIDTYNLCEDTSSFIKIGKSRNFTSPNFPSPYPREVQCRWRISSPYNSRLYFYCPEFQVVEHKTGCFDLFYLSEENYQHPPLCSNRKIEVAKLTKTNFLEVYFNSHKISHNATGFRCKVVALPKKQVVSDCGHKSKSPSRIVGGLGTEVNEWPWQVALNQILSYEQHHLFCGGSLISRLWILTAAHCVKGKKEEEIFASLGDHALNLKYETKHNIKRYVSKIIIHSGYVDGFENVMNDIALLQLKRPVEYNSGVSPICLPKKNLYIDPEHAQATVTGWGRVEYEGDVSNHLRDVTLKIITNANCTSMYDQEIYSDQICTYEEGKDACQGDSGGPLVWRKNNTQRYYQVGIVSYGEGCGWKHSPGVYTRVSEYRDWIEKHANLHFKYN